MDRSLQFRAAITLSMTLTQASCFFVADPKDCSWYPSAACLDGGVGGQAALDRFAQAAFPAFIVGKHAVGVEHVAVLAGGGQMFVG